MASRTSLLNRVLHRLVDEFVDILRGEPLLQEQHTELKDEMQSQGALSRCLRWEDTSPWG